MSESEFFRLRTAVYLYLLRATGGTIHVHKISNIIHAANSDAKMSTSQVNFIQKTVSM